MKRSYEITALFAGIGGLELGLHRSGHRTSLFCEADPEAISVLAARFPAVPITYDVRRIDELVANISPKSDLLTAGFPCTDLSQAGLTKGFSGANSSLIRETIDLVKRRPFPNVLIENVPNWRHLHRGAYLSEVIAALEGAGYSWAYRTIDARAFGVPQRRKRLFLFASLEFDPRDVLFHGAAVEPDIRLDLAQVAHGFYWTEGARGLGWGEDCVPTLKGGSAIGIPAPPAIVLPSLDVVTPDIADGERLQGFPALWTGLEERSARVGGGKFNPRRRWLLVGNAVNVEVSAWIGRQLANPTNYAGEPGDVLKAGARWPEAAWSDGRVRRVVTLSEWPTASRGLTLAGFLRHPPRPLSFRATAGFYSRATGSRLRFVPGFLAAIERHMRRMEAIDRNRSGTDGGIEVAASAA